MNLPLLEGRGRNYRKGQSKVLLRGPEAMNTGRTWTLRTLHNLAIYTTESPTQPFQPVSGGYSQRQEPCLRLPKAMFHDMIQYSM